MTDFRSIGEIFLDVDFESKETNSLDSFTNLTLGCYIVNYAKMVIDMKINDIKKEFPSSKIYMINSDCIYFSTSKTDDLSNVNLNANKFGEWKCDIKDVRKILAFQALSPYNLNITYESCNGEVKNLAKICGFQMQNLMNEEYVIKNYLKISFQKPLKTAECQKH